MKIRNTDFDTRRKAYIMGILNVTPDSFSDGGKWNSPEAALRHAEQLVAEGADILDVGGESTRPGYTRISDEEEIRRIVPVIRSLRQHFDVPISVDTYKSRVAQAALEVGADLVNDIWGLKADPDMARVIAQSGAACCLMHNRGEPIYDDYLSDVVADLQECVALAHAAGIPDDRIMVDPGIGFGKTLEHNLMLMNRLELLHQLGYPILLGTSRKSMIGLTLDLPKDQREEGTLATTVMGVMKGAAFFRVHNVQANRRAADMTRAILEAEG